MPRNAQHNASTARPPLPPVLPQISIIDARKFEAEAAAGNPLDEVLERCELLENKQGQPLLAHGRSGSYTDSKRVLVPMIHGQALLPDLKITDSSEALLTGRAPPFRLAVRAVHRSGEPFEGVAFALSEPFVVRARAAAAAAPACRLDAALARPVQGCHCADGPPHCGSRV